MSNNQPLSNFRHNVLMGTDDGVTSRIIKTLSDGTVVVTGGSTGPSSEVVLNPPTQTPASPTSATVGVVSSQILAANPARTGLVIVNLSSTTVSFGLGAPAVLNSGISLTGGGIWEMDSFLFTFDAIFAIASDTTSLSIQEFS